MHWTLTPDVAKCSHAPVVKLNRSVGPASVFVDAEAGPEVVLDASESYHPDGDELTFSWSHTKT